MIYNSVAEIYLANDKVRAKLIARAAIFTEDEKKARDAEHRWSVAEIIEHLGIIEWRISRMIEKILPQAESQGVKSDGTFNPPISILEQTQAVGDRKLEAPAIVCPEGAQTVEESLVKLQASRQKLNDLRSRIEAADLSQIMIPHPAFGNLNPYQWLILIGLHERRHLAQIKSILTSQQPLD